MNKVCSLFCCRVKEAWIVASDMVATNGGITTCAAGALCAAALLATGNSYALPTGGQVAAGQAAISQPAASQMQINQSSNHAVIDWNSFGIAAGETVNISQPSSQAALLNRVTGNSPSEIFGRLTANGQVFLINPSGVLFAPGASVSVGGLVASSLNIKDDDFMAGSYRFFNDGQTGSVVNRGDIQAGFAALLGRTVENSGSIITTKGSTALGGADSITLNFDTNGLIALKLDQGAYAAQVTNSGVIEADGGRVILTAKSADDIMKSMVNTSGTIRARTVENRNGEILLLGDMENGTVKVAGSLDASAPNGGNGGLVETSAAKVQVANSALVSRLAPHGKNGTWLIDPDGFTIAASGGDMTGAAVGTALAGGDFSINSTDGSGNDGNINVNDTVTWNANKLNLIAANAININAVMTASGTSSLYLEPRSGKVNMGLNGSGFTGRIDFPSRSGSGFLTINGIGYTVINSLGAAGSTSGIDLQGMNGDLTGNYALGGSIDANGTNVWNAGEGFVPLGDLSTKFSGRFNGFGHTISNLHINVTGTDYVGLFGYTSGATISNVGLVGGSVAAAGGSNVGALVGMNDNFSTISNAFASTSVTGRACVGGLVGGNDHRSTVSNIFATGAVIGLDRVGGLAGMNDNSSVINNSSASASVTGRVYVGGLVGGNDHGSSISNSFASTSVTGRVSVGGLVGENDHGSTISNAYATGAVSGIDYVGGLVGWIINGNVVNSYSIGSVAGAGVHVGGLTGENDGNVGDSYWNTDTSNQLNTPGAAGAIGLTTAELKTLSTFSTWNIDDAGDTGKIWRIYDGNTYPLLRSFLTPLTVTANDSTKTHDSTFNFSDNGAIWSIAGADTSPNLFGTLSYSSDDSRNAGNRAITPGGLYSNQQGYDIAFVSGVLAINPAVLTLNAVSGSKGYDGTKVSVGTVTFAGLMGGDSLIGLSQSFESKNVLGAGDKLLEVMSGGIHVPVRIAAEEPATVVEPQKHAAVKPLEQIEQIEYIEQIKQEMHPSSKGVSQLTGFEPIRFGYEQVDLTPSAREVLARNAAAIKARSGLKIRIEGNCDEIGSSEFNMALGEHRANAVLKYLVSMGVPEKTFTVVSYGKEHPVALEHNEAARAKNRRVDLVVISP